MAESEGLGYFRKGRGAEGHLVDGAFPGASLDDLACVSKP